MIGRSTAGVASAAVAVALTAAACGSSGSSSQSLSTLNANGCSKPPALQKVHRHYKPPAAVGPATTYTARIVTNCGTIIVSLDGKDAPETVTSFGYLAAKGYFTDTPCHRLTTAGIFVLQCGDPTGTGTGGPGYEFKDENLAGATYPAGTVAMANSGPNTNGSQFFFVYANTDLPPKYTPFGTITAGLPVLKRIAAAGSTDSNGQGDGAPKQPVVIESFAVTQGAPS